MSTDRFVSLFLLTILLLGCRQKTVITETIEVDGVERTYHIHLPPDFSQDSPTPLVLALHGGGGNGLRFDRSVTNNTLIPAADERGIVLVFPEGIDHEWCDGRFAQIDPESPCQDRNDVSFLSTIIDKMIQDYGVDPARVYATGISNGGFMSFRLAIDLSDKIAAVAPVAAQLSAALADQSPQYPISVMLINGTADPLVPYDGGEVRVFEFTRSRGDVQSTDETIAHFRSADGCDPTPTIAQPIDNDPDDGTAVTIETYTGCQDDTEVILVKVDGGGHTWPGGKQYLNQDLVGTVSQEINASELILDFFLKHAREGSSE